jgi:predicted  nucleic acid-binding Zn-ribbon protein
MHKKELNALEKLLLVQDVDLKIRAIENLIDEIHVRSVQEDPVLNKMRSELRSVTESLDATAAQQDMYENTLEDIRSAIKGLAATRGGAFKPRTRSSTEALKIEEDKLDTLIDETQSQLERLKSQRESIESNIETRSSAMQVALQEPEAEIRKLRSKAKRLERQREEALVGIPPVLLRKYERLQASRSGIGLTIMRNGVCGVCRMTMPTGIRFRLLKGDMIELCPACGRMVARVENTVSLAELTAREQAENAARRTSDMWEEAEEDDREDRESFDTEADLEPVDEEAPEGGGEEGDEERGGDRSDQPSSARRLKKIKAAGTKRALAQEKAQNAKKAAAQATAAKPAKKEPAKKEPAKKEPAKKEPAKKEPAKKEPAKPAARPAKPAKPAKPIKPVKPAPKKPAPKPAAKPAKKPAPKKPVPKPAAKPAKKPTPRPAKKPVAKPAKKPAKAKQPPKKISKKPAPKKK